MKTSLELPFPRLSEGRFASIYAYTDEELFSSFGIRIAFSERMGGISEGPYRSLNVGRRVPDDQEKVAKNHSSLLEALGAGCEVCLTPYQVHRTDVYTVKLGQTDYASIQEEIEQGIDALIIEPPQVAALLCFADCVPIIIVSPSSTFAVVHAGWKGMLGGIVQKAFRLLMHSDQTKGSSFSPKDYNIYIGPYIHSECFETGEDVCLAFVEAFGSSCMRDASHVDLGQALRLSLEREGVDHMRIADVNVCTVCNNDRFYSYRAQGGVCGRHGAFAVRTRI